MIKKPNKGLIVTWIIGLIPVLLWLLFNQNHNDALIKLCGITGLCLLAWNIILSSRVKLLDQFFDGLDQLYLIHQKIAATVASLVTIHFTLLVVKYANFSLASGFDFITPDLNLAYSAGRVALILVVGLTVWTLYFRIKYKIFVISMRVLGFVIFLGWYHALFIPGSDLLKNLPLFAYMATITTTAMFVYFYRSIFRRKFEQDYIYELSSIKVVNDVSDIRLKPLSDSVKHYSGQFAFISFQDPSLPKEEHPFTISSGSNDKELRFCIKGSGDYTRQIQKLKPGVKVKVDGPYGAFSFLKNKPAKQVWVAGGIGITPFLSMSHVLPENGYRVKLHYCVKNKSEAIFLDELKKLAEHNDNFEVEAHFSDETGQITAKKILRDGQADCFMLCGPAGMMKALERQLVKAGQSKSQIYYEEFSLS